MRLDPLRSHGPLGGLGWLVMAADTARRADSRPAAPCTPGAAKRPGGLPAWLRWLRHRAARGA